MSKFALMESNAEQTRYVFFCPGCQEYHWIRTRGPKPNWSFDGNLDCPTVSPSILCCKDDPARRCHSYVRAGRIEFLGDCGHRLAGQAVELPECGW